jgi:hypothetical protein
MEKYALMALTELSLRLAKQFYQINPLAQWPWTVIGEDDKGQTHIFKLSWDDNHRDEIYRLAGRIMRTHSICRYVLATEVWKHLPEGSTEAFLTAGASRNGERFGLILHIIRGQESVEFEKDAEVIDVDCKGDVFTLLGGQP